MSEHPPPADDIAGTASDGGAGAGYADMLGELEAIIADLEGADVDVDVLAQRVARAAELVEACRQRIERARLEVERIVATIDDPA